MKREVSPIHMLLTQAATMLAPPPTPEEEAASRLRVLERAEPKIDLLEQEVAAMRARARREQIRLKIRFGMRLMRRDEDILEAEVVEEQAMLERKQRSKGGNVRKGTR